MGKVIVEGVKEVVNKLRQKELEGKEQGNTQALVGYDTPYAIKVHEDLQMYHSQGQAKYLEQPMRQNARVYQMLVSELMKRGIPVSQALLYVANQLKQDSQELVPVDTGALKASAFTKLERAD